MRLQQLFKTWQVSGSSLIAELFGGLTLNGPLTSTAELFSSGPKLGVLNTVTYSATPTIDASLGNDFVCTITDGVAFVVAAPTNPPSAGRSQLISITFRNTSGGAHGAGTWNAVFKTQATVFPAIATGFSRTIWFRWNGTNWVEVGRTAADVAN